MDYLSGLALIILLYYRIAENFRAVFFSGPLGGEIASYPGHVFGEKSALFPPTTWPGYEARGGNSSPNNNRFRSILGYSSNFLSPQKQFPPPPPPKLHLKKKPAFEGENFRKMRFSRRKLSWSARFCSAKERHAQNFAENFRV